MRSAPRIIRAGVVSKRILTVGMLHRAAVGVANPTSSLSRPSRARPSRARYAMANGSPRAVHVLPLHGVVRSMCAESQYLQGHRSCRRYTASPRPEHLTHARTAMLSEASAPSPAPHVTMRCDVNGVSRGIAVRGLYCVLPRGRGGRRAGASGRAVRCAVSARWSQGRRTGGRTTPR